MDLLLALVICTAFVVQVWLFSEWLKRKTAAHDRRVAGILRLVNNENIGGRKLIIGSATLCSRRKWSVLFNAGWTAFPVPWVLASIDNYLAAQVASLLMFLVGMMVWPIDYWVLNLELFVLSPAGVEEWPMIDDPKPKFTAWSELTKLYIQDGGGLNGIESPPIINLRSTAHRHAIRCRTYEEFDAVLDCSFRAFLPTSGTRASSGS